MFTIFGRLVPGVCGFIFVLFAMARGVQLQKWLNERPRTPDAAAGLTNAFRIGHRIGGETVYISDADKSWEYKFSRLGMGVGLLGVLSLAINFFGSAILRHVR